MYVFVPAITPDGLFSTAFLNAANDGPSEKVEVWGDVTRIPEGFSATVSNAHAPVEPIEVQYAALEARERAARGIVGPAP